MVTALALTLVAAGCGDDSDSETGPNDAAPSDSGSTSGGDATFDEPLVIATMWEVKGESAVAIDDFERGAAIAIDEINEAGGVGGHPVERFRVPTAVLDLQATQAAYLEAIDKDPDVIVGFALPAQVQALAPQITRDGVPVIATANGQPFLRFGDQDGSEYVWISKAYDPDIVAAGVTYFADELGVESLGIMATNESNGQSGAESARAAIEATGGSVHADAAYAPTATDLTPQVLEMKGADAVLHWGFPNTVPVQLNQFVANDISVPTLGNDSAGTAVALGLIEGDPIDDLYLSGSCDPYDQDSWPTFAEFARKYQERYDAAATVSAAIVYDSIYLAVQAAEIAGTADPEAINSAMPEVELADGVCGSYKADGAHLLNHQGVISKFSADGSNETLHVVELPTHDAVG